jgi:Frag1/DRAM/Sfk1 family
MSHPFLITSASIWIGKAFRIYCPHSYPLTLKRTQANNGPQDTYRHHHLHDGFLLLFIAGFVISAIFICAEYQRLGIHYRNHRIIRISFWVKLVFILVEVFLAIVFAATDFTHKDNVAAVFEWIIALIFTFYVLSFLLDLVPSIRTKHHVPQGFREGPAIEKGHERDYEQNLTNDSTGPNNNLDGGYRGTATNGYTSNNTTINGEVATNGRKKGFGRLHF